MALGLFFLGLDRPSVLFRLLLVWGCFLRLVLVVYIAKQFDVALLHLTKNWVLDSIQSKKLEKVSLDSKFHKLEFYRFGIAIKESSYELRLYILQLERIGYSHSFPWFGNFHETRSASDAVINQSGRYILFIRRFI
jgi:hypothetical protein